jgi:hypothetical protein
MPEADSHTTAGDTTPDTARKIVQDLMTAAAGDAPEWSAAGLARGWVASIHGIEGHDSIAPGDPLADALYDAQHTKLNLMGQVASRSVADIAAKLAVVVLETAGDASAGSLPGDLHRITASALADLVLMGERAPGPVTEAPAPEVAAPAEASEPIATPDAAVTHPDAALLAACAAFDTLEQHYTAGFCGKDMTHSEERARDAALKPIQTAQEPLVDIITTTPAKTLDGIRAKAKSLELWDDGLIQKAGRDDGTDDRLLASIMRDLTAGAKVVS